MYQYIYSDLYRIHGKVSTLLFVKSFCMNKSFNYLVWMRICSFGKISKFIAYPIHRIKSRGNIQISYKTKIGYGLYIGHGGPIIINQSTKIGNNCNLSQFTTIGSNDGIGATIGNNVYLGPNCCVVEDVYIQDNVTIGAGSVVTKDIPKNSTAAGNYAKVLNYKNPGKYINNEYIPQ